MCSSLGSAAGEQLLALWEEYEAGVSPEALLLKDLDKLEMILQAYESAPTLPPPGKQVERLEPTASPGTQKPNTWMWASPQLGRIRAASLIEAANWALFLNLNRG